MDKNLIYSVKGIFIDYLSDEYRYYNIPEYQRGYKWDMQQIEQLLKDIDNFKSNGNGDRFYCIQNITLVEKNGFFNVVDGQQRLTTLTILLSFLGESNEVKNKVQYSVRPDTDKFINLFVLENTINTEKWTDFLNDKTKSTEISDYDHQDIFYIFTAYNTIKKWFENKDIDSFKEKLFHHVKLIVNKLGKDTEEQNLFMNLNTGKVSLDGADLVRALILTNVATEEMKDDDLTNTKSIVRINERRVRIGLELDEISAWWNQSNVRAYFEWLNRIKVQNSESIEFNSEVYPIDLLYKLFWAKEGKKEIKLGDFEVSSYIELYRNIIILHRTIKDWYQDCEIYHFVKFIMTHTDIGFKTIWDLWENANSREAFIAEIKDRIRENLKKDNVDAIENLKDNWFENDDLYKILILCDIIQIVKSQKTANKLRKLDAIYFKPSREDIEHIFPKTPIGQKNTTKDDFKLYIDLLKSVDENLTFIEPNWNNAEEVNKLKNEINSKLYNFVDVNSIGNLCLLNYKVNRGYGNDFYTKKRFAIIKNTKNGEHIRPHTLNCFDKGFVQKPSNLDKWTNEDIKANASYIKKQLTDFFKIKEEMDVNNE